MECIIAPRRSISVDSVFPNLKHVSILIDSAALEYDGFYLIRIFCPPDTVRVPLQDRLIFVLKARHIPGLDTYKS